MGDFSSLRIDKLVRVDLLSFVGWGTRARNDKEIFAALFRSGSTHFTA
jgi:hypothetical protein